MADLFDLGLGEKLKAEGMALAAANTASWQAAMIPIVLAHTPYDIDFMAELFRTFPGFEPPPRPPAMGALVNSLLKLHVFEATGRSAKSERHRNHAHKYAIYRRPRREPGWTPPEPRRRRRRAWKASDLPEWLR